MLIGAALLVVSSAMSAVLIRPARTVAPASKPTEPVPTPAASTSAVAPLRLAECAHCGVAGPQLHPGPSEPAAPAGPGTARP